MNRLRSGPPRWSLFRPHALGELLNNVEFFVHHEDVRRAAPVWEPRVLDAATTALLWKRSTQMAKRILRSAPGGIELIRPDTGAPSRGACGSSGSADADAHRRAAGTTAVPVRPPRPRVGLA